MTTAFPIRALALAIAAATPPAFPADIVLSPPATGGVAITNAGGSTTRFRVGDDGIVTLPGLGAVPLPASSLCVEIATGRLGTCAVGTLTSLVAGTGLTGGTITSTGTVALASAYQLPQACTNGQVAASNGAGGWTCAASGSVPAGGTTNQLLAWTGSAPAWTNSITLIGNLDLAPSTGAAGNILKGGALFLHDRGAHSIYAGRNAGAQATTANGNTALGDSALSKVTTAGSNTALGAAAMANATSGGFNVIVGSGAALGPTLGDFNTIVGTNAFGSTSTTAMQNVSIGGGTLNDITSGNGNLALGYATGYGITTGSNNILIGRGGAGGANESGTIRVGNFLHSRAFVAGIVGVTTDVNDAVPVMISSQGQLGTVSSSRRYKDDIADMGEASEGLHHLRPVTFTYKADGDPRGKRLQFGLVAEEVAQVYPGLVAVDADGRAETVMYQFLPPMLLNEVQKQQRTIEAQAARIESLEAQLALIRKTLGLP